MALCNKITPASVHDNNKLCQWERMYNTCKLHLVHVGVTPGLYEYNAMSEGRYKQLMYQTLHFLRLATEHANNKGNDEKLKVVAEYLIVISRLKHCHVIIKFEKAFLIMDDVLKTQYHAFFTCIIVSLRKCCP
jgi:hypothetical protein